MLFFSLDLVAHVRVEFVILYGEYISKDGRSPMGAEYKLGCSTVDVISDQGLMCTHRSMSVFFVGDFAQGRKLQALIFVSKHEAGDPGKSQG